LPEARSDSAGFSYEYGQFPPTHSVHPDRNNILLHPRTAQDPLLPWTALHLLRLILRSLWKRPRAQGHIHRSDLSSGPALLHSPWTILRPDISAQMPSLRSAPHVCPVLTEEYSLYSLITRHFYVLLSLQEHDVLPDQSLPCL